MAKYMITASNDTQSSTFTVVADSEASAVRTIADGWTIEGVEKVPVLLNGRAVDFDAAVSLMDDELRERIHSTIDQLSDDQAFLDAYAEAHSTKYGIDFQVA